MDLNWLRKQIGFVSQDPILFSGTIRENIAYGLDLDTSWKSYDEHIAMLKTPEIHAQIENAAAKANALGFISKFAVCSSYYLYTFFFFFNFRL